MKLQEQTDIETLWWVHPYKFG